MMAWQRSTEAWLMAAIKDDCILMEDDCKEKKEIVERTKEERNKKLQIKRRFL